METRFARYVVRPSAAVLALACMLVPAFAAAAPPVINSVTVNFTANQLTIQGANFTSTSARPIVKFNNGSLTVTSFTSSTAVASLPAASTIPAGAYELSVANPRDVTELTLFEVTIGATGPQGIQGIQGLQGPIGLTGATGAVGPAGATGAQGSQGFQGPQGAIGLTGATGAVGAAGAQGIQGTQGMQGAIGLTGAAGPSGSAGSQGPAGPPGISTLAGDVTGNAATNIVAGIQGTPVTATTPTEGAVLAFTNGQWRPSLDIPAQIAALQAAVATLTTPSRLYASDVDGGLVFVIDTRTNTVVGSPIVVGGTPLGIAVNPANTRVYVADANGPVSAIDTSTNTVTPVINLGSAGPAYLAFNPAGTRLYALQVEGGTVAVIDTATNTVIDTIVYSVVGTTFTGAIAINPAGTRAYINLMNQFGHSAGVAVIDLSTNTIVGNLSTLTPTRVAISPDGAYVYATNYASAGAVDIWNAATNTLVSTISVGAQYPQFIAINPMGTRAYVSLHFDNAVAVVDLNTNTVIGTPIPVPGAIADITLDSIRAYVAIDFATPNDVSVIDLSSNTVVTTITGVVPGSDRVRNLVLVK
jgi:YVTN family beta-propeller protein